MLIRDELIREGVPRLEDGIASSQDDPEHQIAVLEDQIGALRDELIIKGFDQSALESEWTDREQVVMTEIESVAELLQGAIEERLDDQTHRLRRIEQRASEASARSGLVLVLAIGIALKLWGWL